MFPSRYFIQETSVSVPHDTVIRHRVMNHKQVWLPIPSQKKGFVAIATTGMLERESARVDGQVCRELSSQETDDTHDTGRIQLRQ